MTRWLWLSILASLLALAGSAWVRIVHFDQLPDRIPIHWGVDGQPDDWVSKHDLFVPFLLTPAVMAGFVVLTVLLPWLSPRNFKIEPFRGIYELIMFLVVAFLGCLHGVILASYLHPELPTARLIVAGVFLLFAAMGWPLTRVRRNFWMGIRTPWTLASDEVWDRTHWLGGWLFLLAGLAGLAVTAAGLPLWCGFAVLVPAILVPILYSLMLYKRLEREGRV